MADDAVNLAANLFGVAVGAELGVDIGALGPFPEKHLQLILLSGSFHFEPLLFDFDSLGDEVAAAEGGDVAGHEAEAAQFGIGIAGSVGNGLGDETDRGVVQRERECR